MSVISYIRMKYPRISEFFFKDTMQTTFAGKEQSLGAYITDLNDVDLDDVMYAYRELLQDCIRPALEMDYESLAGLRERFGEIDKVHPSLFFATHGLYYIFGDVFVNEDIKLRENDSYYSDLQKRHVAFPFAFDTSIEKNRDNIEKLFNWGLGWVKREIGHSKEMLAREIQRLTGCQMANSYRTLKPEQRLYYLDFCVRNSPFTYSQRQERLRFITTNTAYMDLPLGGGKLPEDYIQENDIALVQAVEIHTLEDLLYFELHHMILQDIPVLLCQYCQRYFVPTGRKDVKYCERIAENETQPCNVVGAVRVYTANIESDEIHAAFKRAYKRVNGRKRFGMTDAEFDAWSAEARAMRQRCQDGEINLEEFNDWLGNNDVKKGRAFK